MHINFIYLNKEVFSNFDFMEVNSRISVHILDILTYLFMICGQFYQTLIISLATQMYRCNNLIYLFTYLSLSLQLGSEGRT